jgi:hypothetical protein
LKRSVVGKKRNVKRRWPNGDAVNRNKPSVKLESRRSVVG